MAEPFDVNELADYSDGELEQEEQETLEAGAKSDEAKTSADTHSTVHTASFKDFLLKPELLRAITDCGFEHPSQVQFEVIPQAILGTDVICQANSGMGKTAVFVLSVLQQISAEDGTSCLILAHTRELAYQISHEFGRFTKYMPDVRTGVIYGGTPVAENQAMLKDKTKCPHILVGTPGRMNALVRDKSLKVSGVKHFVIDECDKILEQVDMRRDVQDRATLKKDPPHIVIGTPGRILALANEKALDLKKIKFFVLDECDSLLEPIDMRADVQKIFRLTPHNKQVMMFSATLNDEIRAVCKKFMHNPLEIYISAGSKLTLHGLKQYYVQLEEREKTRKLVDLLDTLEFNQCVVFVSSVKRAAELNKILVEQNFPSIAIYRGMQQKERIEKFAQFKDLRARIVVATNLLGRGIDVERINVVINYDMPGEADTYLHRVGRAGRFGTKGLAISFVSTKEDGEVLNKVQSLFVVNIPDLKPGVEIPKSSYMQA